MSRSLGIRALAMLALLISASACAGADDDAMDPNCVGSKCDEPLGPPTPHALAVLDCDSDHAAALSKAESSSREVLDAYRQYRQCLLTTNDSAISTIEKNLELSGKLARSQEEIASVFEDFRYASLCSDIESISSFLGDELALTVERCATTRERSLAHVISALVDYTGERSTVFLDDPREQFSDCYQSYDAALASSSDALESYAARQALVSCAGEEVQGFALVLKDAFCALIGCPDDLLITSFIQAGFATALDTSGEACKMLVDASIYHDDGNLQQELGCQLSVYGQLRVAVTDGIEP